MSDENFESWQPPKGGHSSNQLEPSDKLWLFGKLFLIFLAEGGNWLLHVSTYSLAYSVGSDLFLADIFNLSDTSILSDVSVGMLICSVLALAAIATPIFLFGQLLDRHQEIFDDAKSFFSNGLHAVITGMMVFLYCCVIATEGAALLLRIEIETAPSPIAGLAGNEASFYPMLIMSIALIATNAAMGLATAHIFRSTKQALRGE